MTAFTDRVGTMTSERSSRALVLCGLCLLAASCAEDSAQDNPPTGTVEVPDLHRAAQLRAVDPEMLRLVVTVNGVELTEEDIFEDADRLYAVADNIEHGATSFDLKVEWSENYRGANLPLASFEGTLGYRENVRIFPDQYEVSQFDNDGDNISNLSEREGGSDPNDATSPARDPTFQVRDEQDFTLGFTSDMRFLGDVDGDGADDLIWANAADGRFAVALSSGNGTGTFAPAANFRNVSAMQSTAVLVADITSDGRDDIVFDREGSSSSGNVVSVSFCPDNDCSQAGSFRHSNAQFPPFVPAPGTQFPSFVPAQDTYRPYAAQIDGVRGIDLLWNNTPVSTSLNRTYIALAADTPADGADPMSSSWFDLLPDGSLYSFDHSAINFSGYEFTHVADFTGDGLGDIMWQNVDETGDRFYAAIYGEGMLVQLRYCVLDDDDHLAYTALVGDIDGDGRADLVEPGRRTNNRDSDDFDFGTYVGKGTSADPAECEGADCCIIGEYGFRELNVDEELLRTAEAVEPDTYLGDVDGDGAQDLIINEKGRGSDRVNRVGVALSNPGLEPFTFGRRIQSVAESSAAEWSEYEVLVGDVTGDGRDDILWISSGSGPSSSVYVGVARGS